MCELPGRRFCISQVPNQRDGVVIHMCPPQPQLVLYKDSHVGNIPAAKSATGLFEVPGAALKKKGKELVKMEKGGV